MALKCQLLLNHGDGSLLFARIVEAVVDLRAISTKFLDQILNARVVDNSASLGCCSPSPPPSRPSTSASCSSIVSVSSITTSDSMDLGDSNGNSLAADRETFQNSTAGQSHLSVLSAETDKPQCDRSNGNSPPGQRFVPVKETGDSRAAPSGTKSASSSPLSRESPAYGTVRSALEKFSLPEVLPRERPRTDGVSAGEFTQFLPSAPHHDSPAILTLLQTSSGCKRYTAPYDNDNCVVPTGGPLESFQSQRISSSACRMSPPTSSGTEPHHHTTVSKSGLQQQLKAATAPVCKWQEHESPNRGVHPGLVYKRSLCGEYPDLGALDFHGKVHNTSSVFVPESDLCRETCLQT